MAKQNACKGPKKAGKGKMPPWMSNKAAPFGAKKKK